jgi:general secretion pathway protein A
VNLARGRHIPGILRGKDRQTACSVLGVYLDHYGLKEEPFSITPNPRFLFFSVRHREALNHLLYGIRERKGFVQLTGDVGAGKTTLCRALLDRLGKNCSTALILNTGLDADGLLKAIATEFGLEVRVLDRYNTIAAIYGFLLRQVEASRDTVLVIDEAQNLAPELLEQVRMLSNLETDDRKLLQIVLMGQPELRQRLDLPELRQLRQRITVRYHLTPLALNEIAGYVRHRLEISQAKRPPQFTGPALWRVYCYSKGVPRLINAVCDKCLLAAFVEEQYSIGYRRVGAAIRELEGKLDL